MRQTRLAFSLRAKDKVLCTEERSNMGRSKMKQIELRLLWGGKNGMQAFRVRKGGMKKKWGGGDTDIGGQVGGI